MGSVREAKKGVKGAKKSVGEAKKSVREAKKGVGGRVGVVRRSVLVGMRF